MLTGRSPSRGRRSALVCSAIEGKEEEDEEEEEEEEGGGGGGGGGGGDDDDYDDVYINIYIFG